MLQVIENNRSELWLEDEVGVQFHICKTRACWEKTFESYNGFCSFEKKHKTDFTLCSSDVMIHLVYKPEYKDGLYRCIDGSECEDNKAVEPVRIGLVQDGLIEDECGSTLFGNLWKITKSNDDIYYVREISESYDDEVDCFINGKLVEE